MISVIFHASRYQESIFLRQVFKKRRTIWFRNRVLVYVCSVNGFQSDLSDLSEHQRRVIGTCYCKGMDNITSVVLFQVKIQVSRYVFPLYTLH